MPRRATASEILTLLGKRSDEILGMLGEPEAQLSLPTDGAGARVLAALPHTPRIGQVFLRFDIGDEEVEVPVELSTEFEHFRATATQALTGRPSARPGEHRKSGQRRNGGPRPR